MKDWFDKNSSGVKVFTFLFAILLVFILAVKELILTCSILFMIFAMVFVYIAREKEDEKLDIRANTLLIKFYLKSAFFLIFMSAIMALTFIAHKFWPIINIVR